MLEMNTFTRFGCCIVLMYFESFRQEVMLEMNTFSRFDFCTVFIQKTIFGEKLKSKFC